VTAPVRPGGAADVEERPGVVFAAPGGEELRADLYLPARDPSEPGGSARPGIVLLHGGAFTKGSRTSYAAWGRFLAASGIVAMSADYRIARADRTTCPEAIADAKAAVRWLRGHAGTLGVDPARIGVLGGSAGGYLAAMVALTAGDVAFDGPSGGEFDQVDDRVSVVIPMAGLFDLVAWWLHGRGRRAPEDTPLEWFLGGTPMDARERYYAASPLVLASRQRARGTSWLLAWGTRDEVAEPATQSEPFATALTLAGAKVRLVPIEGAPHYWYMEGGVDASNPFNDLVGRRVRTFLADVCGWPIAG